MRALQQSDWTIADHRANDLFVMGFPGGMAFAAYGRHLDDLIVPRTEVPAAFRGRGIGDRLVEGIFRRARERGPNIFAACGLVAEWAHRRPEFQDVLAARDGARR